MVLQVKVKTLDSQNYEFQADEDWTVSKFKDQIQETVNVPALEQRLIFCGRVLQNDKKLAEFDVDGKVIHLVRRPPPASDQSDTDPLVAGASDTNNNDGNFPREFRFGDDNNVLFSAMTLGPDGNMNQFLRHIMTLQQALYARTFGEPRSATGLNDAEQELDRRLNNASRLLRITVNLIAECNSRLPPTSPIAMVGGNSNSSNSTTSNFAEPTDLGPPQSVLSAALSHSDLQAEEEMQANLTDSPGTADQARMTIDDSNVGSPPTSLSSTTRRTSRHSLTTDDLPQGSSRLTRLFAPINELRSRDENRNGPLTGAQRDEFYVDRYMTLLNCSSDVQSQLRVLINRYRHISTMSRCGGLIVPSGETRRSTQPPGERTERVFSNDQESEQQAAVQAQENISGTLLREGRVLSQYVPRILHHHSHLQHALSDFTVDFAVGRLLIVSGHAVPDRRRAQSRSRYVSRQSIGPRPAQQPRSGSLGRPPVVDTSVTITATSVESSFVPTATTSQPQASATIVVTSEPGQSGIHIPVSIPLNINTRDTIQMEIPFNFSSVPVGRVPPTTQSRTPTQTSGQTMPANQTQSSNQSAQSQRTAQETTSNSTQTAQRPFGIISGRIPLPFDYYLTCFSPFANYTAPSRVLSDPNAVTNVRVQPISGTQQEAVLRSSTRPPTESSAPPSEGAQPLDAGLTEVVSNIIGSIFRPPTNQPNQPPVTGQTAPAAINNQRHDPIMNMIPELVINATSQILSGVLGIQNDSSTSPRSQQQAHSARPQTQQQQGSSSHQQIGTVMMDIDIDDSYSSQSESTYQDARESQPSTASQAPRPQTSTSQASNLSSRPCAQSQAAEPTRGSYSREQLSEIFQQHPDWVPIIEADLRFMERQNSMTSPPPAYFSDAYLATIPRKRRRLLVSNPERVLILQPSPSQAISNLLRRAIASSSLSIGSHDQALASIANDQELQRAYDDYLKSAVEERLKTDEDYSENKYRNSSKYFK